MRLRIFHHNKKYPHLSAIAGKLEFSDERNRSEDLRQGRINKVLRHRDTIPENPKECRKRQ